MKNALDIIRLGALFLLFNSSFATAEEKNFGTRLPSENEIIQHFTTPAPPTSKANIDPDDDYQDVSEQDLKNIRGLTIKQHRKPSPPLPKFSEAVEEKAISLQILFEYDSAILTESAKNQLAPIGRALLSGELKNLKFKIEGHTDIIGSDQYNIDLSKRRADAVKQYLVDRYGIAPSLLAIEGKGKQGLADPANPTSEVNRRVRIVGLGSQ